MKRWLCMVGILAAAAAALVQGTSRGQIPGSKDLGPGDGGAKLRTPGMEPTAPVAANPYAPPPFTQPGISLKPAERIALPPSNRTDINKDIEITADLGSWVIFLTAYKGAQAPEMARKCVAELRTTHKLHAYVFNYGAKEKQQEYERVQALKKKQMDDLKNSKLDTGIVVPIRVPTMKIDEQTGVLIAGNYRSREDALEALKKIRKLVPDPRRMDLDIIEVKAEEYEKINDPQGAKYKITKVGTADKGRYYDNPFMKAFPTRNPCVEVAPSNEIQAADLKLLQHINQGEPFSLLKCNKQFTLTVKQFNCQVKDYRSKEEKQAFLDRFDKWRGDYTDMAAQNAHNMAEAFRKGGLSDTYVLHCTACSYVTVGGYDKIDDPRLIAMQNHLETQFRADAYRKLEMYPRPVPMAVPR